MDIKRRIACIYSPSAIDFQRLEAFAEACFRFTPQIAVSHPRFIFLELTKCLNLFSEESIRVRLLRISKYFNFNIEVSFSDHLCKSLAKIYFPEFNKSENFDHLPIEAAFCFL